MTDQTSNSNVLVAQSGTGELPVVDATSAVDSSAPTPPPVMGSAVSVTGDSGNAKNATRRTIGLLITVTAIGVSLGAFGTRTAYEVKVESPMDVLFDMQMTNEGRQGWQPTSCRRATSSGSDSSDSDVAYECVMVRAYRTWVWSK